MRIFQWVSMFKGRWIAIQGYVPEIICGKTGITLLSDTEIRRYHTRGSNIITPTTVHRILVLGFGIEVIRERESHDAIRG